MMDFTKKIPRTKPRLKTDARTKIVLLLLCVLSAMTAPSLNYEYCLVLLIFLFGLASGRFKYALKALVLYTVIFIFTGLAVTSLTGTLRTMFTAFLGLFHKVYPCGMMSGILIATTHINEFLSAMNKIHLPKKIIIPLAVMLRYIPTVKEDWHFIKDAMKMRDVSPSLKGFLCRPAITAECVYVPLLMSASKAADELSVAAVARGIENPKPRTCLIQLRFTAADFITVFLFAAMLLSGLCFEEVFL